MFKNILLTVDLTHPESWAAAMPQAVELARVGGAILHVVSVVPDYGMPLVAGFFPDDFAHKALAKAREALKKIVADGVPADIEVRRHVAYGEIHHEVLKTIESTRVDLVVMASHAPDTVREFLVGSHADRIVRRSPVSVLVVRAQG
ncbi:MAG: nucleotide-binding universal stress UspA family protein [Paracoccaceae bacterium]|jgi:nucleotide-binding universal stress UspA family protein